MFRTSVKVFKKRVVTMDYKLGQCVSNDACAGKLRISWRDKGTKMSRRTGGLIKVK